jgi:hypothetical protein
LKPVVLEESGLHRMKLAVFRESFDGGDFILLVHHREGEAGIDAPSVHVHGAGAALPVIASFLRAEEAEIFPQRVEQRQRDSICNWWIWPLIFSSTGTVPAGFETTGAGGNSIVCGAARSSGVAVAAIPAVATLVRNDRRVTP